MIVGKSGHGNLKGTRRLNSYLELTQMVQTHTMTVHTEAKINRESGSQLDSESVSQGVWHRVAQHVQKAVQRSAKPLGRPILRRNGSQFPIYLGLGVYGHGVCLHRMGEF